MIGVLQLSAGTIGAVAFLLLVTLWMHISWSRKVTLMGPTVLTTGGIFFCFVGIAWGLLDFDAKDIGGSVPALLDGIRTAFWASVAGIFGALTIKGRLLFQGEPALAYDEPTGATVDDLIVLLQQMNRSIGGNEDSTLLSQTKLLRSDTRDQLEKLNSSFERFAITMAEQNSKALIQALSEIIRDFNVKLNEQFGDNFKQLNQAVERLVDWQTQYEKQLTLLIEQQTETRRNMTAAAEHYSALLENAEAFSKTAGDLRDVLKGLDTQRSALAAALTQLAQLVDKAATGLPQIETKIVEMTSQIEAGVKHNHDTMTATLKGVTSQLASSSSQFTTQIAQAVEKANADLNAHVRKLNEDTNKHVVSLDAALEEELELAPVSRTRGKVDS